MTKLLERIVIDPEVRNGKPIIKGTRITVYDVLEYLAGGMTQREFLDDFPYLTEADVLACLSYAADREKQGLASQRPNSS